MKPFVLIVFGACLFSSSSHAQSEAEDVNRIKYISQRGVVCEVGSTVAEAKAQLNTDLNGTAVTPGGQRGVDINMDDDKHGIIVAPFTVSAPSITVKSPDPKTGDQSPTWAICVTVQAKTK